MIYCVITSNAEPPSIASRIASKAESFSRVKPVSFKICRFVSHLIIVWAIGMIFLILQLYHKNKMIDIDRLIKIYNIILQYVPNKYLQYKKFLK